MIHYIEATNKKTTSLSIGLDLFLCSLKLIVAEFDLVSDPIVGFVCQMSLLKN